MGLSRFKIEQSRILDIKSLAVIDMDVMAAIAIPAIAAFGHPVHHMPITQDAVIGDLLYQPHPCG
jgi:hypothetical protein